VNPAVERWLLQRWYGGQAPGMALRFLAGVYQLGLKSRAALAPRGPADRRKLSVPVVVVGNFTAGGTGKTPLVIALADYLRERGFRPGVVSRGYGRSSREPVRVGRETPVEQCGDEPKLIFERTGVPVLVDRDRLAAASALVAEGCGAIIADDGLQHANLPRDIEIEVLDGERRYGNGWLIPAGPLREAPRPVDLRVVIGADGLSGEFGMRLRFASPTAVANGEPRTLDSLAGVTADAIAGIGNPGRFFQALRALGVSVREHAFADHHAYRAEDFSGMAGPLLMTEKDAVKCRELGLRDAWAMPVQAELPVDFYRALDARLEACSATRVPRHD
jgi:tetraacyldisaccharide 4'-kinase